MERIMQCEPGNDLLEDHQNIPHVNTLVTLMLKKNRSHRRSASTVAITPSVMDDSSAATIVEVENATTEEHPRIEVVEEVASIAPHNSQPQSDAQRLAVLVRSQMKDDEPQSGGQPSYSEDSGYAQPPPPSPSNSPNFSMSPSDLIYIDSILTQHNTREMEATAQLRKRISLRSRMRKLSISILRRKDQGAEAAKHEQGI